MLPVVRNEATHDPSSSEIWATDEPKMPGSIRRATRATPSSSAAQRGAVRRPRVRRPRNWATNCTTPATNTPMASTVPGEAERGASQAANAIMIRLSSTGLKAAVPKRP